jgi:hypothetical protein
VNLQVDIVGLCTLVFALVAGFWAIGKTLIAQFEKRMDERFESIAARFSGIEGEFKEIARIDRDVAALRIEMMREYVRSGALERLEAKIAEGFAALNARLEI